MTTKLDRPLRREILIGGDPYVVTIAPTGLKLTRKGRRKGIELAWKAMISGDAALAVALNASVREPGWRKQVPQRIATGSRNRGASSSDPRFRTSR